MTHRKFDEVLQDYVTVSAQLKELEAKKDELKAMILVGYETESFELFSVKVLKTESDRLESLKAIEDKSPSLFQALHEAGCVKKVESVRLTVKPIAGGAQ